MGSSRVINEVPHRTRNPKNTSGVDSDCPSVQTLGHMMWYNGRTKVCPTTITHSDSDVPTYRCTSPTFKKHHLLETGRDDEGLGRLDGVVRARVGSQQLTN